MMGHQARAVTAVSLLGPGDKANTAAATGSWIDVTRYEGDLCFVISVGTVTAGDIDLDIEDATDISGTGAASITPDTAFSTGVTTATTEKRYIRANSTRGFIRFVGTITTGPAEVSAVMLAHPGHVGQ